MKKEFINKIFNESCFDLFEKLSAKKIYVDAIITDPPYNISKKNHFQTIGRQGIDFGEWDKDFNQREWLEKQFLLLKKVGALLFLMIEKILEKLPLF
nr:hypothetical protein [Mycoplasma leonicaptivi]